MAEVVWAEPAVNDLQAIVEYIARDSRTYAERFAYKVLEASKRVGLFPRSGRIVPEFDDADIRELIYGSYRIIYLVGADACYVVALVHGSRRLLQKLSATDWNLS